MYKKAKLFYLPDSSLFVPQTIHKLHYKKIRLHAPYREMITVH